MSNAAGTIRILLVDDNPADRLLIRALLVELGPGRYAVSEAANLREAKAILAGGQFDAAITDLSLPDSDGLMTVDRLHTAAPHVPLVVLTGIPNEAVALEAVRSGAQDYLVKGRLDAALLARAIRYAIDRNRDRIALQQANDDLEKTVRQRTEELHRANHTLRMITECNEALVRAADEYELVREICQIIVNMGGYRMAWVGYAEDDEGKSVLPVGAAGFEEGYLQKARISWADNERGRGPTGTCIRTGQVQFGRDFLTDPRLAPWREAALKRGFRSSIALPLVSEGKAFGALTIYAEQAEFFDEGQTLLLKDLADDLGFGIVALRSRIERDHARRVAEQRAEQLRALAAELVQAEQRERRRLAKVLHDHLQQLLVGAKFNVGALKAKVKTKMQQETTRILAETLDEAIKAARSLTAELSPPILHDRGLGPALEWLGRQMHEKHGLTVAVHADDYAEPEAEEIRIFLFEAARELLFNAVKHAGIDHADVRLSRIEGDRIMLTVADDGAGFDPRRLDAVGGSEGGFGLFSIRERLGYLGGHMTVDSAPGRGTRFTLVTPLRLAVTIEAGKAAAEPPAGRADAAVQAEAVLLSAGPRIRVLLADDHAVMREGMACLLREQPDIEIVGQASDGQEAVDLARQLKPDVVIMDVAMPHLDGLAATRLIMGEMPQVRVIGLSLHEAADMADAMRAAGAAAYLSKAGPADDLLAAIRKP
jgi:DNA-binding NarL/FixJ family response regulator/signal transduction histidine kinase